jgi:hypothetical protein
MNAKHAIYKDKLKEIEVFLSFMEMRGRTSSILEFMKTTYSECLSSPTKKNIDFLIKEKNTLVREMFGNAERTAYASYQKSHGFESDNERFQSELTGIFERGVIQNDDEFDSVKQFVEIIYAQEGAAHLLERANQMLAAYESKDQ